VSVPSLASEYQSPQRARSRGSMPSCPPVVSIRDRDDGVSPNSRESLEIVSMQEFTTGKSGLCMMYPDGALYRIPASFSFACARTNVLTVMQRAKCSAFLRALRTFQNQAGVHLATRLENPGHRGD
jgi:hypothetical protein